MPVERRASAGQSHFYQNRHPNVSPSPFINDDGRQSSDVSERQPVLSDRSSGAAQAQRLPLHAVAPTRVELEESYLQDPAGYQRELDRAAADREGFVAQVKRETGIGPTVSIERPQAASPQAASPPVERALPTEPSRSTSVWAEIPSGPLKKAYARLKSSAGMHTKSDGFCTKNDEVLLKMTDFAGQVLIEPTNEGSYKTPTKSNRSFRPGWEKVWRFFALNMDSTDDATGYLDMCRFEDLVRCDFLPLLDWFCQKYQYLLIFQLILVDSGRVAA